MEAKFEISHQRATHLFVSEMQMHRLVHDTFGEAQATDPVQSLGEGYEYPISPLGLAVTHVIAWLSHQRMNCPYGCRDDRRQVRNSEKQILYGAKPKAEALNRSRLQAFAPKLG